MHKVCDWTFRPRLDFLIERNRQRTALWANKQRACPRCSNTFKSVQDLGACPQCNYAFHASHPEGRCWRADEGRPPNSFAREGEVTAVLEGLKLEIVELLTEEEALFTLWTEYPLQGAEYLRKLPCTQEHAESCAARLRSLLQQISAITHDWDAFAAKLP